MSDRPFVEVHIEQLAAGGQLLVRDSTLRVEAGELVLLVGASGTGKSVLLRVMAELIEPAGGVSVRGEVRRRGSLGVVFQQGALFEQMSLADNLRFASDHATPRGTAEGNRALMDHVRIPPGLSLAGASGGQRRRIAIARALASAPEILLYDEPTAGLDPDLARVVAALIRQVHDQRQMATLVVTHDFPALAPIAHRIAFLDPAQLRLVEVTAGELTRLVDVGAFRAVPSSDAPPGAATAPAWIRRCASLGRAAARAGGALGAAALPRWRHPAWGLRFARHFFGLVAGPTSLLYVGLAGAVAGCVSVYFSFRYLPYSQVLGPLVTEDLLGALGFALYRVLVPILATTLVAARCGAALASDLAGRSYREELAAMRVLGAHPGGLLGFTAIACVTVATPLLVLASFVVARAVALSTYGLWDPLADPAWIEVVFHGNLRKTAAGGWYAGTPWVLVKSATCGLVVGAVAAALALPPKRHPDEVSAAVTRTVLVATALVLIVHAAFAFLEF